MKAIKYLIIIIFALILSCSPDDNTQTYNNTTGKFVRFFLLTNSNNEVLEYPEVDASEEPLNEYTKNSYKTLKIPVALTAVLQENVTVNFATEATNLENVSISPANSIEFAPDKLVDTIYVSFNQRWDVSQSPKLKFTLTQVSDNSINLGMPNTETPHNELTISFAEVDALSYQLQSPNSVEIIGEANEEITIDVLFPSGYFPADIENMELLNETNSNINYTLTRLPLTSSEKVSYTFTVNEAVNVNELEFKTVFTVTSLPDYEFSGAETFTITKPIVTDRDNSVNTAGNFYNLNDQYYRTYGENWMDSNADGECKWQGFFAFTYPVVVDANHPNAVLYSDNGTADTSDDVYHHAFRVGFNTPIANRTTNSFNLKRWFTNEGTNADTSPGFNVNPALEFYPENGTSATNGYVKVIEQDLTIGGTNGNVHVIRISGNGTYEEIETGLFEITLTLNAYNEALFGGTRVAKYKIYNKSTYPEPENLSEGCFQPIEL